MGLKHLNLESRLLAYKDFGKITLTEARLLPEYSGDCPMAVVAVGAVGVYYAYDSHIAYCSCAYVSGIKTLRDQPFVELEFHLGVFSDDTHPIHLDQCRTSLSILSRSISSSLKQSPTTTLSSLPFGRK